MQKGKTMKKLSSALLGSAIATTMLLGTPSVQAQSPHEFSANVATTTDYRFRGISQSNEDFAIQGGFDYSYLPYNCIEFGGGASTETNFYGGFTGEVMNGIGWDVGALYYFYPDNDFAVDLDYYEIYGSLSYDFGVASVTGGLAYSPDYFAESDTFLYYYGDVSVPLNVWGLSINGHVGYNDIDDEVAFGTPSYTDYSVGISKDIGAFTFDVSYVDTDLSGAECFGGPDDICDSTAIFTVSAGF